MPTQTLEPEQEQEHSDDSLINEREAQQMQDWYDLPSYEKEASKADSSDELEEKESTGSGNFTYSSGRQKDDKSKTSGAVEAAATTAAVATGISTGAIYKKLLGSNTKKAGFGGILISILLLFFLSIASGPAQFVQIAQLMQQFHLASHEDESDDRVSKLYRFIKSGGDARETRVGSIGSRMAKRIDLKFRNAGLTPSYEGPAKTLTKLTVDKENASWKGMTDKEIGDSLRASNVEAKMVNGNWEIEIKSGIFQRNGPTIKWALKKTGVWKVASPIQSHVFGKWAGVLWHPMRPVDKKINEKMSEYKDRIKSQYEKQVAKGAISVENATTYEKVVCQKGPDNCTDEEKAEDARRAQVAEQAAQDITELDESAKSVAAEKTRRGKYTNELAETLQGKLAGTAVKGAFSATAALCMLNEMNNLYEQLKIDRIVLPLTRLAWHAIVLGNQVINGDDADPDQLAVYNDLFNGDGGSWMNAPSIQAQLGHERSNLSENEKAQKSDFDNIAKASPFLKVIDKVNEIVPGAVGKLCSTAGQVATAVITIGIAILSGGTSSIASTLFNGAISGVVMGVAGGYIMHLFASMMAGTTVDPYLTGSGFGTNVDYGSKLAANDIGMSRGGRKLSNSESQGVQYAVNQEYNTEFASKSLAYRIFNPNDYRSTFGKMLSGQPSSFSGSLSKVSNSFLNFGSMIGNLPSFFSSTAKAAAPIEYDYGFSDYGFSVSEINSSVIENPYANAAEVTKMLDDPARSGTIISRASKCFGVNISKKAMSGSAEPVWSVTPGPEAPNPYDQTTLDRYDDPKWNCGDGSTEWLRVRFFIFDTTTMDAISCFEEDDSESCNNVGFDQPATGGAGGVADCSSYSKDPATWGDQSAGSASKLGAYQSYVEKYAPARACPGSMFTAFQTPSGAIPNDPNKQYFGTCSGSTCEIKNYGSESQFRANGNECGGAPWYGAGNYMRLKYRNPPRGGNTICVPVFDTATTATNPGPTNPSSTPCPDPTHPCSFNTLYKIGFDESRLDFMPGLRLQGA